MRNIFSRAFAPQGIQVHGVPTNTYTVWYSYCALLRPLYSFSLWNLLRCDLTSSFSLLYTLTWCCLQNYRLTMSSYATSITVGDVGLHIGGSSVRTTDRRIQSALTRKQRVDNYDKTVSRTRVNDRPQSMQYYRTKYHNAYDTSASFDSSLPEPRSASVQNTYGFTCITLCRSTFEWDRVNNETHYTVLK
jgi:hypothetical protein